MPALCGILALLATSTAGQEETAGDDAEFVVVVHADNPVTSIERKRLSDIFLKRRGAGQWRDWKDDKKNVLITPVDNSGPIAGAFNLIVHDKTETLIRRYWQQVIFSGRGEPPPDRLDSDREVLDFVCNNRGAIGYVSPDAVAGDGAAGCKVIEVEL